MSTSESALPLQSTEPRGIFVDILVQRSSFRDLWRQRRWILWLAGMLLAVALANVWIIGQLD